MKKFFLIILLLSVGFTLYKYGFPQTSQPLEPKSTTVINKINIEQKIENNESFTKYEIEENKTVLDLLKQTAAVVTKGEKENAFVTEINGKEANESKKEFWAFYLNGKMSPVGAGSYKLKNKDRIEWKIEKY